MGDRFAHTRRSGAKKRGRRQRQKSPGGQAHTAPRTTAKPARNVSPADTANATRNPPRKSAVAEMGRAEPPRATSLGKTDGARGSSRRRRRQSDFSHSWREKQRQRRVADQRASDVTLDARDVPEYVSAPLFEPPPDVKSERVPSEPLATLLNHVSRVARGDYGDYGDFGGDGDWYDETWDAGWTTSFRPANSATSDADGHSPDAPTNASNRSGIDAEIFAAPLGALARLGPVSAPIEHGGRPRVSSRRRPAAMVILALFVVGFMLTCVVPLIPVLRLGYDVADATRRITALKALVAGDPTQLINTSKLQDAQNQVAGIQRDLYEINGTINIISAPLSAMSSDARNYRLLVGLGLDMTLAANGGIQAAQTILKPVESGGILGGGAASAGITSADIQQARVALANAHTNLLDAYSAYEQLDQQTLPDQFKPGSTVGKLLAMIPTALSAVDELNTLLDIAPALLGVGQPAYYLVAAMDSTELRPGGGFIGNYGILGLDGGKQLKSMPLSLHDTYPLDQKYYQNALQPYRVAQHVKSVADVKGCASLGPQPPAYYWWWPFRDFDHHLQVWLGIARRQPLGKLPRQCARDDADRRRCWR